MCGIAGVISKTPFDTDRYVSHFREALKTRGQDGDGYHANDRLLLYHTRLAILDVENGHQPMYSSCENYVIAFNGEIYNYRELREELIQQGYSFTTNTDTEVVLYGYIHWGNQVFSKLDGMFAIAIYDIEQQKVILARDMFGTKPLFYSVEDDIITFGSTLASLVSILLNPLRIWKLGTPQKLSSFGLESFCCFRYVVSPHTLFEGIYALKEGTYAEIDTETITLKVNRFAPYCPTPKSHDLYYLLQEAVRKQIEHSERPVGLLLSGGLDSSTIAYFSKQLGFNLKAYNVGFPDCNEFQYSRRVAHELGLDYTEVVVTPQMIVDRFDEILPCLDYSISDAAVFPLFFLAERIAQDGVKVVLSGEGGDEVFGGYGQYQQLISGFADFLKKSWYQPLALSQELYREIYPSYWSDGCSDDELWSMQQFDLETWMPSNLMVKADRVLMRFNLEGRFPFLDKSVVWYGFNLAEYDKVSNGKGKVALKRCMRAYLPSKIIDRPKMGFSVPLGQLLGLLRGRFLGAIGKIPPDVPQREVIEGVMSSYYAGRGHELSAWYLGLLINLLC